MLPREFGRFERRSLVSSEAIICIAVGGDRGRASSTASFGRMTMPRSSRASTRFGVLVAFSLAQLALVQLRRTEPDLRRPFRAGPDVRHRRDAVPLPALVGSR